MSFTFSIGSTKHVLYTIAIIAICCVLQIGKFAKKFIERILIFYYNFHFILQLNGFDLDGVQLSNTMIQHNSSFFMLVQPDSNASILHAGDKSVTRLGMYENIVVFYVCK